MASFNKVTIIGNLGADPDDARYMENGNMVLSMRVAVNERRAQSDGQVQDSTQWFRVACWGKLAEDASSKGLSKGDMIFAEGPLQVHEYTGNDGQKRFSLDLRAREFRKLGSGGTTPTEELDMPAQEPAPVRSSSSAHRNAPPPPTGSDESMDDIPF